MTEAIHFGNDFNSSVASLRPLDALRRNRWRLSVGITGGIHRNTHSTILGGDNRLLLGSGATEAAFKALPLADFRVIHLAAHGVADSEFPDRAALVLGAQAGEDGLLQVREIQDLPIHAELVTLSACDTGAGRLLGQEGITNLEQAFLLAGARSVIASVWTADDFSTAALMKSLYAHLADGHDKGAALRQAKLDFLAAFGDKAIPAYWAGFTLVGDGSTGILTPKFPTNWKCATTKADFADITAFSRTLSTYRDLTRRASERS